MSELAGGVRLSMQESAFEGAGRRDGIWAKFQKAEEFDTFVEMGILSADSE